MTESTALNPSNAQSIRVLTYNIYGHHAGWSDRRKVVADGLRALSPDLIAFQETIVRDDTDQVWEVLGGEYDVVHSEERHSDGMGISIASRWPISNVDELDLHVSARTEGFPCTTLIAEVEAPPIGRLLLVHHFPDYQPHHERERELQTVIAARHIEDRAGDSNTHVVLAGDLDADAEAASIRFLRGRQSLEGLSVCYRNAWESVRPGEPGHTFTKRNALMAAHNWDWPYQRIDHIFVRCGENGQPTLTISSCDLAFAYPVDGVWGSDHIAVVADLELPAEFA